MAVLPKLAKAGPVDRYISAGGLVTLYESHSLQAADAVFNTPDAGLQDGSLGDVPTADDVIQVGNLKTLRVHIHSSESSAASGVEITFFADKLGTIPIAGLPANYPKSLIGDTDIQEEIAVPVCQSMKFSYTNGAVENDPVTGEFDVLILGRGS
jgi:hypothetical protein